jgi:hypothetical protein
VSSKILAALFLVGGTTALYAGPVYSCGGGAACDGNLYAVWVVSQTATSYVLDVGVQVTSGYTGSTIDSIKTLAIIPDNQKSFSSASLTGRPTTGTWSYQTGGLTNCNGSGSGYICGNASGTGSHLFSFPVSGGAATPNLLVWQFTIVGTPPSLGNTAHIKYNYVDLSGNQVGSLGSFDAAIQCIGGTGCTGASSGIGSAPTVPEPVTSALIGSGLIGLYFLRRRLPR